MHVIWRSEYALQLVLISERTLVGAVLARRHIIGLIINNIHLILLDNVLVVYLVVGGYFIGHWVYGENPVWLIIPIIFVVFVGSQVGL